MKIYIVRRGDTLFGIARKFGTSIEKLAYDNQLSDPSRLPVGLALVIPAQTGRGVISTIEANGYAYPNIAESTAAESLRYLTFLCPFSWQANADGSLEPIADEALISAAYAAATAPLLTITNLRTGGGFSSDTAHAILTNAGAQERFIENMLAALRSRRYYGVNIDFEYIYSFDAGSYNQFIRRIAEVLHSRGYYFITTLAPKESDEQAGLLYEAHDYAFHGRYADRVILMTYEWGYTYSAPQAVSPVNRMRSVLSYAVSKMPAGKIIMGYSNYGYNWTLPWRQGSSARVISNAAAVDLASSVFAQIEFDELARAPYFNYTDVSGVRHEVWFEDARSARARLALVADYGLAGISYWTINQLYRPNFLVLESMYNIEKII